MTRRAIELDGIGKTIELKKVTCLKIEKEMIHLDKLPDGNWRLIYTEHTIPDIQKLLGLKIIRED